MKHIVVAVAITGSVPRRKDNPAVPITPAEQIESTHEAYEAGASLVHIHVRNDDESSSSDPDRFDAVQHGIRRYCPGMIIQFSTGGRGRDPLQRGSSLHLQPDMASLATGSVNFPTTVYANEASLVTALATKMREHNVLPEIEIFDLSHLYGAKRLVEAGLINQRPHVQFVIGNRKRAPCSGAPARYSPSRTESQTRPGLRPALAVIRQRSCGGRLPGERTLFERASKTIFG